ncbi:unnamed protein product [Periconia digitata]|uniref:F-box domain-containing protein n=1 Tax=Periconia digitata TaxID=1303443 RepID=A0A9W4XQC7_9PLEO|nr:unnamed protein product [Periconia digitata]
MSESDGHEGLRPHANHNIQNNTQDNINPNNTAHLQTQPQSVTSTRSSMQTSTEHETTCSLQALPEELLLLIIENMEAEAKNALRLTSGKFARLLERDFLNRAPTTIHLVIHPISMARLSSVTTMQHLARRITSIQFSTYMLESRQTRAEASRNPNINEQEYITLCNQEQSAFVVSNGNYLFCHTLFQSLPHLPNLRDILVANHDDRVRNDTIFPVLETISGQGQILRRTGFSIIGDLVTHHTDEENRLRRNIMFLILHTLTDAIYRRNLALDVKYYNWLDVMPCSDWIYGAQGFDLDSQSASEFFRIWQQVAPMVRRLWVGADDRYWRPIQKMFVSIPNLERLHIMTARREDPASYMHAYPSVFQPLRTANLRRVRLENCEITAIELAGFLSSCQKCTWIEMYAVYLENNFPIDWRASFDAMQRLPNLTALRLNRIGYQSDLGGPGLDRNQTSSNFFRGNHEIQICLQYLINNEQGTWADIAGAWQQLGHGPNDWARSLEAYPP